MLSTSFSYKEVLMKNLLFSVLIFSSLSVLAHADDSDTIEKSEKVKIGNGWAYTYVLYKHGHVPSSVGIALSESAMQGLPLSDTEYSLHLPRHSQVSPYKEIVINWNPHGHEPTEIYGLPHFDFHFYFIPAGQRHTIKCMDGDALCLKQPPSDQIAPYYVPAPAGVPMMGWHWLDSRSPELHGEKFTATLIEGYYNAKMIFVEPMITREFILGNGTVNKMISLPEKVAFKGFYPGRYTLGHDGAEKVYRIVLKDLKKL
jgi:hypothetical protein